jgi:hypothetical protein
MSIGPWLGFIKVDRLCGAVSRFVILLARDTLI